jgi:hypothetical protein
MRTAQHLTLTLTLAGICKKYKWGRKEVNKYFENLPWKLDVTEEQKEWCVNAGTPRFSADLQNALQNNAIDRLNLAEIVEYTMKEWDEEAKIASKFGSSKLQMPQ